MSIQKMMKFCLMLMLIGLSACEKSESWEIDADEANSLLQVRTRAAGAGDESVVSYPVHVYVFKGSKCVALQTIEDENQTLSIPLVEGAYSVYAFGGATSENYLLPTMQEAAADMEISLRSGQSHGDLMAAKSNVTLVDGGTNTLTLAMERKVMLLQSVVLNKIPTSATAVSITLSPLWQRLEGTDLAGETGAATIDLTEQEDGKTWKLASAQYLLPPSESSTTITVNIVKSGGTSSYTYNTGEQLGEGYKLNIEGTYTEAVGVTLAGTITGSVWKDEKTITFEFDESGSSASEGEDEGGDEGAGSGNDNEDNSVVTGTIPSVGDSYNGCYVFSVSETDGVADVLLLSPKSKVMGFADGTTSEQAQVAIEAAMQECSVSGISEWRLMTGEEANMLAQRYADYSKIGIERDKDHRLLMIEEGVIKAATMGLGQITTTLTLSSTNILRPVTLIRIAEE